MKKQIIALVTMVLVVSIMVLINSCSSSKIDEKSGSELWGENCGRCHNSPSPSEYSNSQWEVIGNHMKLRANFSDEDVNKMVKFLKSAN